MTIKTFLAACALAALWTAAVHAAEERLPIGEFTATRFEKAPLIDGKISPGEWDRAFTTSGLMAPFEHELQESETTMSLGFDAERFYFLFRCRRGNQEWKLWKHARFSGDYSFGDPSVEIWVTPPTLVPETYQNTINTYPAMLAVKNIPSRGCSSQGWKGDWKVGVSEDADHYIVEAFVPIKDFGFERVNNGDVWRFLLARNCLGAKPRSQASWSLTQGFAEFPQHPKVHLMDDELVAQLTGVATILTGKYALEVGLVAPRAAAAEADVELRFHKGVALPAQEIRRENGKVYLRINFFAAPTEVKEPRTITWGWQTFPSRPLPPGWRATFCAPAAPVPHARNTYFWIDADWAVLWPYYCSPFAWHFDKSKLLLDRAARDPRHRPCVGSIAHSIGRYQDYDGNSFPGLAVDWGASPGEIGNANITSSKGPNDFRLWHYQRWVREGGFRGLYVDENYLALEDNFLTGNAYWRGDGLLQRAYNYVGLRDYFIGEECQEPAYRFFRGQFTGLSSAPEKIEQRGVQFGKNRPRFRPPCVDDGLTADKPAGQTERVGRDFPRSGILVRQVKLVGFSQLKGTGHGILGGYDHHPTATGRSQPPAAPVHSPVRADRRPEAYNDAMDDQDLPDSSPLLCARCDAELKPGTGNFYVVRIEALADPTPPSFSDEDMKRDHRAEIERLVEQMRELSERELLDQVYRRLILYLCGPCYRQWIEEPVK
jgi:hypothetical protein